MLAIIDSRIFSKH